MNNRTPSYSLGQVVRDVSAVIVRYPSILIPFMCIALFDFAVLVMVLVFPSLPAVPGLSPLFAALWEGIRAHYPGHNQFVLQLFIDARNMTSLVVGVFFTGLAISALHQAYAHADPHWVFSLRKVLRKYGRLVLMWGIVVISALFAARLARVVCYLCPSQAVALGIAYALTLLIQVPLVYALPLIIVENKKVLGAIERSIALTFRHPRLSILIVFLPALLLIPINYWYTMMPRLVHAVTPHSTVQMMSAGIIITNVAELLVTIAATIIIMRYHTVRDPVDGT